MVLHTLARKCCCIALATYAVLVVGISSVTADDSESQTIQKLVQDSQRAGLLSHNLDEYMSLWTDDAKIICSRSEKAGPHDFALTRKQFEGTRKLRFRATPVMDATLEFADSQVEIDGDKATLTHRATFLVPDYIEEFQEVYRLRKTYDGWMAYENRWWPIKMGNRDRPVEYTKETWKQLDRRIELFQSAGGAEQLCFAQMNAFRYPEALKTATKWTEKEPKLVEAWITRGYAAVLSGEAEDAEESFKKALEIDPECEVPEYIRVKDDPTSE